MTDDIRDFRLAEWGPTVILRGNNTQDRMSALGQKRTLIERVPMSALCQKRTSLPLSAHTMPRKQIREGHQRPSSSRHGVLASLIRIKGRVVNLI